MNRGLVSAGVVMLLLWSVLLRPAAFAVDDSGSVPWNTVLRDPVAWQHGGTEAVLGACGHGACSASLRTPDAPEGPWNKVLYWRSPWSDGGTQPVSLPRSVLEEHGEPSEAGDPETVSHRVSAATYHARDATFDLAFVASGAFLLRLGLGGERARHAAVAWAAVVPFAPFVAALWVVPFAMLMPPALLAGLALGLRWAWQRPSVRRVSDGMLEASAVLLAVGIAMRPYFPAPPLA